MRDLAALGRVTGETSSESVLRGLVATLVSGVPGCSGGSAELWIDERVLLTASHSELIALAESEAEAHEGPATEARATRSIVVIGDVFHEPRWPGYAGMATRCGVRSAVIMPIAVEPALLLLGLYSVRPNAFGARAVVPLAEMLAEQVAVALGNMWDFDEVRTDAAQMHEALAGRAVIDQAKGIIMQISGCTADEAFDELRRVSQHHQVKIADLARLLVSEHQNGNGRSGTLPWN
ncbi:AmiR/NasT family two-component response regulator [Thermocatellispora tengchongensis]|uniref:AmiR/NasT family two-component response regulator n=1 Tax=Thermocatellispora tengchongensis TaxID=1073253 RepID=A0A840P1W0_9ACTN|nr:GAF and ANTAR domain-containing protein [Thermocatellispora tengchongensis]MBB5131881.1 AmiR/NasT family two-component response regulator [Thermocatellispora tengchongensis]